MLLLVIASLLSSFGFYREAKRKGYKAIAVGIYPMVVGIFTVVLTADFQFAADSLLRSSRLFEVGINIAAFLLFFWAVARAWKKLKALPTAPSLPAA
jgi:hypothetical protein